MLSPYLVCRNPKRRRTRLRSAFATGKSLSKERSTRFDFVRRRWLRRFFSRRSLRLLVTLKRLAVDLCVFILGTVILLFYRSSQSLIVLLEQVTRVSRPRAGLHL